jgi:hypothetical protein
LWVVRLASDGFHPLLFTDDQHLIAIVLDLMNPVRACGRFVSFGGEGKLV